LVNQLLGPVPGAVRGRFGNRKPPTVSYATFLPTGPPTYDPDLTAFMGGLFWDGRAANLVAQVPFPLANPNEMNDIVHNMASTTLVVQKVASGSTRWLFERAYGQDPLSLPTDEAFQMICQAIAAYESSQEVSPFSSKYDRYVAGKAQLSPSELNGLRLVTGSMTGRPGGPPTPKFAQCVLCHGIPSDKSQGPDLWTNSCYANIGVPKNRSNP
jgi:cytochrome c peroxidase